MTAKQRGQPPPREPAVLRELRERKQREEANSKAVTNGNSTFLAGQTNSSQNGSVYGSEVDGQYRRKKPMGSRKVRFFLVFFFPPSFRPSLSSGNRFDHTDNSHRTLLIQLHNQNATPHDENEYLLLISSNLHHRIIHLSTHSLYPLLPLLPLLTKLNVPNDPSSTSSLILCQYRLIPPRPLPRPILPLPPILPIPNLHLPIHHHLSYHIHKHPCPYRPLRLPGNLSNSHLLHLPFPHQLHSSLLPGFPNPLRFSNVNSIDSRFNPVISQPSNPSDQCLVLLLPFRTTRILREAASEMRRERGNSECIELE